VMANHAPLLATLDPAELRLHLSDTEVKRFAQAEGYLQVFGNHALVLVEECVEPEHIDREAMRERLRRAEQVLERIDQEVLRKRVLEARTTEERDEARQLTAEYDKAVADKQRAEVFLALAGESTD
jgi:F0F1-type ATP synthase epsilon subunit